MHMGRNTLAQNLGRALMWASLSPALLSLMPSAASATMLTFTHTGNGSGTLNGMSFPASDFVITATGDTADRVSFFHGWWIPNTSASIWIAGLGNFDILVATHDFVNTYYQTVGFSQGAGRGVLGHDLFDGPTDTAFSAWDMSGPIGPVSGTGELLQWTLSPQIDTTGGILVFNDGTCPTTYTVVPEPATLSLLALVGMLTGRCRRA